LIRVKEIITGLLMIPAFAICFFGCTTPEQFKEQADEEVYSVLDEKWQPEHGVKANYRISDVAPEPNDVRVDPNWIPSGRLTLAEAVAVATAQSREYQDRKESLYSSALVLTLRRHEFVRQWFGTIDGGYTKDGSDESVDVGGQLGFDKLMAQGTQISTAIAVDWMRFLTGDPRTSLGSVLSASVTQPLLRGSSKEVVQENLTQTERNVLYQIRSFARFRKSFLVRIVSGYLRTLESLDSVKNAESNYVSLRAAYDAASLNAEAGRLPPYEADQTEQRMLQARDNLARTQRSYEQDLDNFKLLLAIPVDTNIELDPNEMAALTAIAITEPQYPVEDAVNAALNNRLDLTTAFDQVDDAKRKVDVAVDALRAQLDLVARANIPSTPETKFERLQFHEGRYDAGLLLDLPLDRLSERNVYRRALISYLQAQRDYELASDEVKLGVRNAYRSLVEAARRYVIQKNSLELAQERVSSTTMLLAAGRAQSRDLLDAQDSLLSAQNDTTATLVDYMIARLTFYRDTGILQVKPDGLWKSVENENEKLF
jgi:outer membrane protein TolC